VPLPTPVHQVRLDRQGNAISPVVANMQMPIKRLSGHTVLHGPGAEPIPAPLPIVAYRADKHSFSRNMEAYDLALLIDVVLKDMGGLSVNVTEAEFALLPGDVRQHFMPIRKAKVDESTSVVSDDDKPSVS
jgi:hypothetical protein